MVEEKRGPYSNPNLRRLFPEFPKAFRIKVNLSLNEVEGLDLYNPKPEERELFIHALPEITLRGKTGSAHYKKVHEYGIIENGEPIRNIGYKLQKTYKPKN